MTTINDQPQEKLARYADRTGCENLLKWKGEHPLSTLLGTAQEAVASGATIEIVLSEYGLPSHLPPYKDNPRLPGDGYRVPTGEDSCNQPHEMWNDEEWMDASQVDVDFSNLSSDYRLPASVIPPDWEEMTREDAGGETSDNSTQPVQPEQKYPVPNTEIFEAHGVEWYRHTPGDPTPCNGELVIDYIYRSGEIGGYQAEAEALRWSLANDFDITGWRPADAPAKLPRPEPKPQDAAKAIQTLTARAQELESTIRQKDFEIESLGGEISGMYAELGTKSLSECNREFLRKIKAQLAAASTPTLRPIAEMPDAVPEGCVRVFGCRTHNGWYFSEQTHGSHDTHYIDIQLPEPTPQPDPLEQERQQFEEWFESSPMAKRSPAKSEDAQDDCWEAWKAARNKQP